MAKLSPRPPSLPSEHYIFHEWPLHSRDALQIEHLHTISITLIIQSRLNIEIEAIGKEDKGQTERSY